MLSRAIEFLKAELQHADRAIAALEKAAAISYEDRRRRAIGPGSRFADHLQPGEFTPPRSLDPDADLWTD